MAEGAEAMKHCLYIVVAMLVTACSSTSSPPPYAPPVSAPVPVQPPIFTEDFTPGTFNVAAWCEQHTPVNCNPALPANAIWTSFNRPGDQGLGCVGFGPNDCWQIVNGAFVTKDALPGFPIISAATFSKDKPFTIRARLSALCDNTGCWGGFGPYDGELDWKTIYFSYSSPGFVVLSVWTPTNIYPISAPMPAGTTVDLEIGYDNGTWIYRVNGIAVPVPDAPRDNKWLLNDFHIAAFSGTELLTVYSLQVLQ